MSLRKRCPKIFRKALSLDQFRRAVDRAHYRKRQEWAEEMAYIDENAFGYHVCSRALRED